MEEHWHRRNGRKIVRSQPLWVIGAPRSGTTFLGAVLNRHPMIALTNESRLFVLLKDLIEARVARPDLLDPGYRPTFLAFLKRNAGELVERFYREQLGILSPIWGDKHPPYADPSVLSGRNGASPHLPRSGSCLRLIREVLPRSKFIHIHRDPGQVAYSLLRKGWVASLADGVAVWQQYVSEIITFFGEIEPGAGLTIAYSDLLREPTAAATAIARFLDLADAAPIANFLVAQHRAPTPFSEPVTDLAATYRAEVRRHSTSRTLAGAGEVAERLGYARV